MASPAGGALTWPDYTVLAVSLLGLIAIGGVFSREQRGTSDFFLARRRIPWWAACLSFLATEISAVTIISVPATAYSENWEYAQFFVGQTLAKFTVALLFIPAFYRYDCTTIYEFLERRFGTASQVAGSIFFFVTRLLGSGVRLMAACLAVSVLVGWPLLPTIALFSLVSIAYIALGGVKAVVWTNVFQASLFLVGGGITVAFLASRIDGGLGAMFAEAAAGGTAQRDQLGPGARRPGLLAPRPDRSEHRLARRAERARGLDGGLRHRLRPDAAAPHREDAPREPAHAVAHAHRHARDARDLPRHRRGAVHVLRAASRPGAAASRRDLPALHPHGHARAVARASCSSAIVLASIDSPLGSLATSFVADIYRPLLVRGPAGRATTCACRASPWPPSG